MKHIALLSTCIVALGALVAPGAAHADNADVTAAVARWSLRIAKPAKQLQTKISSSATPQEALVFLRSFTTTATNGTNAIAGTRASTAKGTQLRSLASGGFAQYAAAGRLLIQAVKDVQAGKGEDVIRPKVNKAVALATSGSAKLNKAATLIPQLVGA